MSDRQPEVRLRLKEKLEKVVALIRQRDTQGMTMDDIEAMAKAIEPMTGLMYP
jgi:hypothetical protein